MAYGIIFTGQAQRMLQSISDRRIQTQIIRRSEQLANEPEKQGRPLSGELAGYWSVRAVGQRYRIVYQMDQAQVSVIIIATGIRRAGDRRDVYSLARRLVFLGLTEPPEAEER
ncbi:MAG TPA: type II toxin-antitoxin system RelE/ParE family toxin [Dehalococcoidia bacterium]|nr:type II toxin-antitoxin system RelE/ParE family toxin [Dehalococcoidia bacterium]